MKGKTLPLGVLSEKRLGLSYEGNFAVPKKCLNIKEAGEFCSNLKDADIRSEEWMRRYLIDNPLYDRSVDYQFWLIGKDKWVAAGEGVWEWEVGLGRVLEIVKELPENTKSMIVVHPDYFKAVLS